MRRLYTKHSGDKEAWRQQNRLAEERVARLEAERRALQQELEDLRAKYIAECEESTGKAGKLRSSIQALETAGRRLAELSVRGNFETFRFSDPKLDVKCAVFGVGPP